jgi:hypothetical protein
MRGMCGDESRRPYGTAGARPIARTTLPRASRREAVKIAQGKALGMKSSTMVPPRRGRMICLDVFEAAFPQRVCGCRIGWAAVRGTCGDVGAPVPRVAFATANSTQGLFSLAPSGSGVGSGFVRSHRRASQREAMKIAQGKALGMRSSTMVPPRRGRMISVDEPKLAFPQSACGCRIPIGICGVNHAGPTGRRGCGWAGSPGCVRHGELHPGAIFVGSLRERGGR